MAFPYFNFFFLQVLYQLMLQSPIATFITSLKYYLVIDFPFLYSFITLTNLLLQSAIHLNLKFKPSL